MNIVFKISDNLKDKVIKYYQDLCLDKKPPYAVFQAKELDNTTITLYESGKLMFQGLSADIEASIWIDLEKKYNNRSIDLKTGKEKEPENKKNFDAYAVIGSDEVGTGDYFGPIVVTASFVTKNQAEFLHSLGVTDSKKLTDEKIKKITPEIIKVIPYAAIILKPQEYNKFYSNETNMNKIKAILHNKVLLKMLKKNYPYDLVIVDEFTPPKSYYNYLKDNVEVVKNIKFMPKAESQVLAVACSSIISRYIFLKEMANLETMLGQSIPKGAGLSVDELGIAIAKKHGLEFLANYAKLNFKNTTKIKEGLK